MGRVVRFGRPWRNKTTPRRQLWQPKRHAPWQARAPWLQALAVAALFAAATAGYAVFHPDSAAVGPNSVAVLRPHGAGAGPHVVTPGPQRVTEPGSFRLCAERRQPNCVVDGDTIRYGGVKIRLGDLDTPEVFSPKCASEAALGRQATHRLLELINAGPFELVRTGSRDEDRYGRKLRILERHGRSLSDTLIAEGLARPWDGARRSWCG